MPIAMGNPSSLHRWALTVTLGCFLRRSAAFFLRPHHHSCLPARQTLCRSLVAVSNGMLGQPMGGYPLSRIPRMPQMLPAQVPHRLLVRRQARIFSPEVLEEVSSSVSIIDVMKNYLELREGSNGQYQCRCPFHDDEQPSMSVSDTGVYHCFGCGAKGNTINFLCEVEGLSFAEAVEKLAEMGGVELPEDTSGALPPRNNTRLYAALESAAEYYSQMIMEGPGGIARSHLSERRISPGLAADFQLGFSPPQQAGLYAHLSKAGVTEEEMEETGLFYSDAMAQHQAKGQLPVDRFSGRLIIPIHNAKGQVVGFGGRVLRDEPKAKYVNNAESPVFRKRSLLFGLHRARPVIREQRTAVVVEGYFDVIALHGAGMRNAVGSMGTALTHEHMKQLRHSLGDSGTIVVCLDGDAAGLRAVERACREVFLALDADKRYGGITVKIAALPAPFKDPADFCMEKGAGAGEAFKREVVERSLAWKEWYGLRLIGNFRAGIRDEAAVFGRLSEALTDFLASLPPNKQADRTFLSSLLADRAFPNQPALRDQLVADLIQCSQDKAARRVNGQQPWQAREVVQPPRVVNTNSAPPASQPNTRPPPAAAATPQAPPQAAVPMSSVVVRPNMPQQQPVSRQYPQQAQPQQPPPPQQQQQAPPSWANRQQQQAMTSSRPVVRPINGMPPAPSRPATTASGPLVTPVQQQQQQPPPPPPQSTPMAKRGVFSAAPPPIQPPPSRPAMMMSSSLKESSSSVMLGGGPSVSEVEESVLRLAIAQVDIRAVLHELFAARQLFLSTPAHQALYDWLFRQPRGVVLEDNPEVMADIFGNSHTQFKGLRSYFVERPPPERERAVVAELPDRLAVMLEASITERARRETRDWRQRLQRLEIQYDEAAAAAQQAGTGEGEEELEELPEEEMLQDESGEGPEERQLQASGPPPRPPSAVPRTAGYGRPAPPQQQPQRQQPWQQQQERRGYGGPAPPRYTRGSGAPAPQQQQQPVRSNGRQQQYQAPMRSSNSTWGPGRF